jgi:membrane-associated protein
MMHNLLDPSHLVKNFGYVGIFIAVFLESGVVIGFFLPGDSLLFTAGLLASQGFMDIYGLVLVCVSAAVLGNNVGYYTGRKMGPSLFSRDTKLFSKKRVSNAHKFFESKGPEALVIARFIPAARTFVPIIAGAVNMEYSKFFKFNAIGALLWGVSLPVLGYSLGKTVPNIDKFLLPIIAGIIILSALPAAIHYIKAPRGNGAEH